MVIGATVSTTSFMGAILLPGIGDCATTTALLSTSGVGVVRSRLSPMWPQR